MAASNESAYLNIEQSLQADASGDAKRKMVDEFRQYSHDVRAEMNKGVAPDEYKRLEAIEKGLTAAAQVVEQMWARLQKS